MLQKEGLECLEPLEPLEPGRPPGFFLEGRVPSQCKRPIAPDQDSTECQQLNCYHGFEDQGFLERFPASVWVDDLNFAFVSPEIIETWSSF